MAKQEEMSDDFREQITQLSQRIQRMNDSIGTEEATKNAMVMPFFSTLGYDVFNPAEVIPEYTCDVGIKKNEKIDYAICRDGQPVMLVECKHWSKNLDSHADIAGSPTLEPEHLDRAAFFVVGGVLKFAMK